jgi:NAD(P)-dependent dehydrogenase (short-subunit alcohol dehydrogenase family)
VTAPVALVSGGTGGLGSAIVHELVGRGYRVYCATRERPSLAREPAVADGPNDTPQTLRTIELDVTSGASIDDAVGAIMADAGRIDVLVNNAGVHRLGAFEDMPETDWRYMLEVNFFGVVRLTRAVLPILRSQRSGHIIMISSVGALISRAADAFYCASKSALEAASEALRYEVAPFGIDVSIVQPGAFRTDIVEKGTPEPHDLSGSPYASLVRFRSRKVRDACRKGDDPSRVARLVADLAGERRSSGSAVGREELRFPAGAQAEEIVRVVRAAGQRERDAYIRDRSQVEWWLRGGSEPGAP